MTSPAPAKKALPPYLPFKTFLSALESWRVVLPGRIDRGVLGTYAGTMQTWVMATLRFFDLVDIDGTPTDLLKRLVHATEADRSKLFADLARHHYPYLFVPGFDLARATHSQLREKFEATGAQGETAVKAMSFFVALAKAANIQVSPFIKTRQRRARNGRKAGRRTDVPREKPEQQVTPAQTAWQPAEPVQALIQMLDVQGMDDAEQAAVWTLIRYLKKRGS